MALKIDMAKEYDWVEWRFLVHILKWHGFSDHFINLISWCISLPNFSIMLNGSLFGKFKPSCGILQGDPISPALFTIMFDLLSRILTKAEIDGQIHGIKVCRESISSQLMFADDLTLYYQANLWEGQRLLSSPSKSFASGLNKLWI